MLLTVLISDKDVGGGRGSFSDLPGACDLWAKIKCCYQELIKLQHTIIDDVKALKCRLAGWCEDEVIPCTLHISATRHCTSKSKLHHWGLIHASIHNTLRVTWALPKTPSLNDACSMEERMITPVHLDTCMQ